MSSYNELILRHFRYDHLPPHLQEISKPFHDLAHDLNEWLPNLPYSHQKLQCMQRLLEAKDAAVRVAADGTNLGIAR